MHLSNSLDISLISPPATAFFSTRTFPGLDPLQSTPVPVSYTKYVTKHMSKIEMGKARCCHAIYQGIFLPRKSYLRELVGKHSLSCFVCSMTSVRCLNLRDVRTRRRFPHRRYSAKLAGMILQVDWPCGEYRAETKCE